MTSANVIEYTIERNGEVVGHFRKHLLCKLPDYTNVDIKYALDDFNKKLNKENHV